MTQQTETVDDVIAAARIMTEDHEITYTLASESGASLRGAGWKTAAILASRNPSGWQSRPGREWHPVVGQQKIRWEAKERP